jgi:surface carbohydrate biosynthesis protein
LGLAAAARGHTVVLGKLNHALFASNSPSCVPPGIFHDNSPGDPFGAKVKFHTELRNQGFVITGQDEEHGLAGSSNFAEVMQGRFTAPAMEPKAAMFAFGEHDLIGIRQIVPQQAEKVIKTGSPRVDFWRRDFKSYFDQLPPRFLASRPYILWTMSAGPFFAPGPYLMDFGNGEASEFDLRLRLERLRRDGVTGLELLDYAIAVETICAVRAIAARFPHLAIVYRPHPVEAPGVWESLLGTQSETIFVVRDQAVSPWVRDALCVVFSGSTVGFEAAIAGIPSISFQPNEIDLMPTVNLTGARATTVRELVQEIDSALHDCFRLSPDRDVLTHEIVHSRFAALEGPLAADRIIDAWENLATESLFSAPRVAAHSVQEKSASPFQSIVRGVRNAMAIDTRGLHLSQRNETWGPQLTKFPAFNRAETQRIFEALCRADKRFGQVRMQFVGSRRIMLEESQSGLKGS